MKKFLKVSLVIVAAALLSSCNCYKKMAKDSNAIRATSAPALLSLRGNTVNADVTVTFPAGYFNKKAILRITPVMVFEGGEIAGTPKYIQGERVKDNYTIISGNGGSYTQAVSFNWDPRLAVSRLELRFEAQCKNKDFVPFALPRVIATGVSMLQTLASPHQAMEIMPDNFRRVTTNTQNAEFLYDINKSVVRNDQLTSSQIRLFEEFIRGNANADRTVLSPVSARGYASPDGPTAFNDQLSRARSESGSAALGNALSNVNNVRYDINFYGEDWDGFRRLVEASNIPDRNLILQVLQMYSSPVQREQEIKNMSAVFEMLAKEILPQLRRTVFTATADVTGKTDAELLAAARNNIQGLNLEEALFAATLTDVAAEKAAIYRAAAERFNDARAYNNYAIQQMAAGDVAGAKASLQRAVSLGSNPAVVNNQSVIAVAEGNLAEARRLATSPQTQAFVALAEGNFAEAARSLTEYNRAVAQAANGDYSSAKTALANQTSADADFLKAIIAAREGQTSEVVTNLRSAIQKNPALRSTWHRNGDLNRFYGTSEFSGL